MNLSDTQSILRVTLLASFADGAKHDRERDAIRDIAQNLGQSEGVNLPSLYQDVLLKRVTLEEAAAGLGSDESRQLAYEMAVCVCDADGALSDAERQFLDRLRDALKLPQAEARAFEQQAGQLGGGAEVGMGAATAPVAIRPAPAASAAPRAALVDRAELEARIRNAAITNGALELLPETLSTMAIIPLQMRLVYNIGKAYGYELDSGHIKDFLATVGVGLTSQYLEQAGRKLIGGLLRKVGGRAVGGLMGGLGKQAVSSGMSFASTYALGYVALEYYAGGRQLSAQMLKDAYARVFGQGQQLQTQLLPEIRQRAQTINMTEIMNMVRGQRV
ncbi:MAG: DUF533 domain-containing protein [Comamonadaceae bacterium]|nr:DUF533 domain-containing protein [Comamonadaceae bacterium]